MVHVKITNEANTLATENYVYFLTNKIAKILKKIRVSAPKY